MSLSQSGESFAGTSIGTIGYTGNVGYSDSDTYESQRFNEIRKFAGSSIEVPAIHPVKTLALIAGDNVVQISLMALDLLSNGQCPQTQIIGKVKQSKTGVHCIEFMHEDVRVRVVSDTSGRIAYGVEVEINTWKFYRNIHRLRIDIKIGNIKPLVK